MKKPLTLGEKWLFALPLLFLAVAAAFWMRQKSKSAWLELTDSQSVKALGFSPDSRRLVVVAVNGNEEAMGEVYDLEARSRVCALAPLPQNSTVWKSGFYDFPSWSGDGKQIAASVYSRGEGRLRYTAKEIAIWDAQSGAVKADYLYPTPIGRWNPDFLRFSKDGKTINGGGFPTARFDVATGKRLNQHHPKLEEDIWLSLNEKLRLLALRSPKHRQFQVVDSKTLKTVWDSGISKFDKFEWCDDTLYVKQNSERFWLWNGKTRKLLTAPQIEFGVELNSIQFSPDRKTIAYAVCKTLRTPSGQTLEGLEGKVVAWDYRANRMLWSYDTPLNCFALSWSPDGKRLATLGADKYGENRLLILSKDGERESEHAPSGYVVRWSPDSKTLVVPMEEMNSAGNITSSRLEIHRFEDE